MEDCVSNLRQWSLEQGLGTDEDVLVEVLTSRTNEEIREMARVFGEGKVTVTYYVSVFVGFSSLFIPYIDHMILWYWTRFSKRCINLIHARTLI